MNAPNEVSQVETLQKQLEASQHEVQKFVRLANKFKDQGIQLEIQIVDKEMTIEKLTQKIQTLEAAITADKPTIPFPEQSQPVVTAENKKTPKP